MPLGTDLLKEICKGIRDSTHVGEDTTGATYELPFTYVDGSPIEVTRAAHDITDEGKTLLRLVSEQRLDAFNSWEGVAFFLRRHRMERRGTELLFAGDTPLELVRYINGLRLLEQHVPRAVERSEDFDVAIRRGVRDELENLRNRGIIDEDIIDTVTNPELEIILEEPRPVSMPVFADFSNRSETELIVVLSHPAESLGDRVKHINHKLSLHRAVTERNLRRSRAVLPKQGGYGDTEAALIHYFTGQDPLRLGLENGGKKLAQYLVKPDVSRFA